MTQNPEPNFFHYVVACGLITGFLLASSALGNYVMRAAHVEWWF